MKNYLIKVEYLGLFYSGFQKQNDKNTIQKILEESIEKLLNEKVSIIPSGRTDAGVSAENQICSFKTEKNLERYKFLRGINYYLPKDISVKDIIEVDFSFNPRRDAKKKTYRYSIFNAVYKPALNNRCFFTNYNLDLDLMKKASKKLVGEHDFNAFKKVGSSAKTSIRKIYKIRIKKDKNFINIEVEGNGFLYNMVRIIAGTLFEIASKKLDINSIDKAFTTGKREYLGKTLPPEGLTLIDVKYGKIDKLWQEK